MDYKKEIVKLLSKDSYSRDIGQVFTDFVAMSAIVIQNGVLNDDKLEQQYLDIVKDYLPNDINDIVKALSYTALALAEKPCDVLGEVYHTLELHNKWKGQYFTPYDICKMMSCMIIGENIREEIAERGYITVNEPTCGSGAMVIAASEAVTKVGGNPQCQMFAVCTDIDIKCVHMAYIQLSLLGIPAQVIHGNSLTLESYSVWNTPSLYMSPHIISKEFEPKEAFVQEQENDIDNEMEME